MNTRSKLAALWMAICGFFLVSGPAYAEDLLANSSATAFDNMNDSQHGMAPLVLGIVGFTVVLGMVIRWVRKAG